jgi:hypothetical protein
MIERKRLWVAQLLQREPLDQSEKSKVKESEALYAGNGNESGVACRWVDTDLRCDVTM